MPSNRRDYSNDATFENFTSKMTVVTVDNCFKLNIREEPDLGSKIIAVLNNGEVLEKTDSQEVGSFSQVRLKNGSYGYAMSKYLKVF